LSESHGACLRGAPVLDSQEGGGRKIFKTHEKHEPKGKEMVLSDKHRPEQPGTSKPGDERTRRFIGKEKKSGDFGFA